MARSEAPSSWPASACYGLCAALHVSVSELRDAGVCGGVLARVGGVQSTAPCPQLHSEEGGGG